ncbi:MAG: hypothetical protein IMF08_00510 [Proteobacteria bacterium]|nr:hypothetical protein [Pseudomonadota bacterium]
MNRAMGVGVRGSSSHARAEEWMLMGREGDCVTLAQAAERRPVFSGISTPDQLVDRIREQGEEVSREDILQGDVTVVKVDAPRPSLLVDLLAEDILQEEQADITDNAGDQRRDDPAQ